MKLFRPRLLIAALLSMLLVLGLSACGGEGPTATPSPTPTASPVPPTPTLTPTVPAMSEEEKLAAYAAEHAGGAGAIFVGDPQQLLGPPPHDALMLQVPEAQYNTASMAALFGAPELGLPSQMFIYTSDYYQGLLEKANLTNPTPLTSSGESIEIQHTCLDRNLPTCVMVQAYWAPNVARRTNGQVNISITSFVELGLSGPETLDQVGDGTLDMVDIYSGYVAGVLPPIEIQSLWGMSPDWETSYSVLSDLAEDIDATISEATGGSHVLNRNWFAGSDQWFFSDRPLQTTQDFEGLKIRSHAASLSDFIRGMGAEPQFLGPTEIYNALDRGFVDAVPTSPLLALADRLNEVSAYMSGPIIGFGYTNNVINKNVWDRIPPDLQQILTEEGAKAELEALRLAPFHNIIAVQINQTLGVQPVPFSEETRAHIHGVVFPQYILPGWLDRLGYPGDSEDVVSAFNDKVSPYLGIRIAEDGSLEQTPITKGPRAQ